MMTNTEVRLESDRARYIVPAVMLVPQILLSLFAVFWLRFEGFRVAGCETRCDYATAYGANVGLWIALPTIAVLAFVGLVVWYRRPWIKLAIVLAGIALTILALFVATQVVRWSYVP
jgi:hypothetical protein